MGYAFFIGTSMAAPHISGVAALMKSIYPGMTPANFDALLAAGYLTQDKENDLPNDTLGYGIIDAYKAALVAEEAAISGEIPPILSVTPRALNFGTVLTSLSLTVKNSGDGTLILDSYNSDASWLTITPSIDIDGNGFGTYNVVASRDSLEDGIYTTSLTFEADTQQARISVIMQVGSGSSTFWGGYHYILLIDANDLNTEQEIASSGENGHYEFSFTGLSYGDSYLVYAGTDPNNDSKICTEGETCGAYLSRDMPFELMILENLEDINFTTNIRINIPDTPTGMPVKTGRSIQ